MNIKVKAFLQIVGCLAATVATIFFLEFISPEYAFEIFLVGVLAYLLYQLYIIQVWALESRQERLEREKEKVVNILKN